uniref:Defensin n=1 Tax=Dermacentor reticulatus TaxID=57047 RepID=B6UYK4_DERRT|nr:defensin [Dermacentor reticulatus]
MRGLCICLVFILVCGLLTATAAVPAESEAAHLRVRRGGYCSGIIKQTCTCYRN